jgi:hypothetical protein
MSDKSNFVELKDKDDFGFSFVTDQEVMSANPDIDLLREENVELKRRLHAVANIFMPLLINLSKNPDKPMIRWEGRAKILEAKMKELRELTDV